MSNSNISTFNRTIMNAQHEPLGHDSFHNTRRQCALGHEITGYAYLIWLIPNTFHIKNDKNNLYHHRFVWWYRYMKKIHRYIAQNSV